MKHKNLFKEGKIGNLTISSRVIMAPMGTKSDPDGGFCTRDIDYFVERAKGGAGMIITGRVACSTKYEMRSHHVLDNYHQVNRLAMLCEKVHHYGTKLCVQIGPGLGRLVHQDPFTPPYSASAVPSHYYPDLKCKPYEKEDIKYLAWATGFSASLAKRAGADAVELHAYGGYLLDQFMSTLYNKRTDEYGGSLENRMRFTLECIEQIQEQCGKDFPLIVKFTADQACEGGRQLPEGIEIAKMLEAAGVQAIHVDKGCYECWYTQIPTVYGKEALQLEDGAAVKAAVHIPVIGHGKLNRAALAERVIKEEKLDFVAMAHQMISDPYWAQKVKEERLDDIVPCIGCNECLYGSHQGKDHSCAVNPRALREADYPVMPAEEKDSVLVIGGGPGGMEAAITAVRRGFRVELWEKDGDLGGNLRTAGAPSFKQDVIRYKDYLIGQINKLPIKVKLNYPATAKTVEEGDFDKVILASGAAPFIPPIPGADKDHVKEAMNVLLGREDLGKKLVVIGGGLVGCEVALHLNEEAGQVTIVEMLDDILAVAQHCQNNDAELRKMIADSNINVLVKTKTTCITDDYVEVCGPDGVSQKIPCDNVIIAAGFRTNHQLEEELKELLEDHLLVIGDAVAPRKIYTAVHEGFHAARLI
ncbi:MAG: NAD(P)/FAD-dependent oxidoreductase [Clostridiales Family XIII bacterium]|uniref:NAD(P)/FAD-dependent oxidoreductase n=1 Tax=Hominibacterium faecale TaxID=2839743 RepID=UPI0022B29E5E|nr:NAD(P)/FAD-dependent oxidoreductase [Hominibacterium faecale]MCI7301725.1 NAD(P)/FAD-dependent oxidoreductase [Clostridia bacterium]MDY3010075.1 NAD(P)/FAD-dependent oxidoreductase [Clostridiales Family XIII bacterium]